MDRPIRLFLNTLIGNFVRIKTGTLNKGDRGSYPTRPFYIGSKFRRSDYLSCFLAI